jgi:hypothetical protein
MPLYKKALNFNTEVLESMTYDDCYELLLCFRYLYLRDDPAISKARITEHMDAITKRMEYLKSQSANNSGN